ncbi:MAG: tRNA (N(6)-L-threonylcarbamoyladenosine(37)-C(2))-methylthiotransferase MtaB [Pseudomonadota bacterium]
MQVHLKTLGCRLNEAELESWAREFRGRGHRVTASPEQADLVVVNTCAVTEEAVRKSRKLLRRAHRENPAAKLVVSGCFPSLDAEAAAALPGVDLVVNNRDKDHLPGLVMETLDFNVMPAVAADPGENTLFARGRQRAFVKVQDGCRHRCTYCIVTLARGEERSRSVADIVEQVNSLAAEGVREVVLTGVHLGGFGRDRNSSLRELLVAVLADTDVERLRLGSLEPWDIPPGFWSLFHNPRLMPHLHLPLQSGADPVLRRMARRGRTSDFRALLRDARSEIPDLNVTTDIIVGFPGESEDEFARSLAFAEEMGFGHLHVFAFSPRAGTKAAALPDQIDDAVKRERSRMFHRLAERSRLATLQRFVGRELPVLVEHQEINPQGATAWGYTPGYLRVAVNTRSREDLVNSLVRVRVTGVDEGAGHLVGTHLVEAR